MASRFATVKEDTILATNEAVVSTNTTNATKVCLSVFTGR